ncbi:MAG: spore coat protein [Oscillospiraceae bacterium]|jgi:spore coat protein CotF|nr:spore coat protein [Oscillospiraceae bacterium]
MAEASQGTLGDKEMVFDLLSTQKHITSNHNTRAGECKNTELRDAFLSILKEEHNIQSELFDISFSRGWYPVKEAPASEVNAARTMLSQ